MQPASPAAVNSYHWYLFTSRSSTDHEVYVDGKSIGSIGSLKILNATLTSLYIGHWNSIQNYNGEQFEIAIHKRGFTSDEVAEWYDRERYALRYKLGEMLYFFPSVAPSVGALSGAVALTITPSGNLLPGGNRRITQVGAEVAVQPDERRISQAGAEVAVQPDERRISQVGVEVAVLTSEVGWVAFAFTPSMRLIGSATRGATNFTEAAMEAQGRPLDEALVDCPTGFVDKDKVTEDSIVPGAVSIAHSFSNSGTVNLNQNDGALIETHALSFNLETSRDVQIFFTGIAKTTNVQGDHMLLQAEIRENGSALISKSVILTIAKGDIDRLFTISFRASVPIDNAEYTVHMNINDNSTSPTVRERTMFARDIKV